MSAPLHLAIEHVPTAMGTMILATDDHGRLRLVDWEDCEARLHRLLQQQYRQQKVEFHPATVRSAVTEEILRYFDGDLLALDRIEVVFGGTEFQREVWNALRTIPCGQTLSYGELAQQIGRPKAVRAVGLANGANLIGVVVPCHRVIGANGTLTGYGGGLPRKQWLLEHEGVLPRSSDQLSF